VPIHLTPSDVSRFWAKVNLDGPVPPHRPDLGPCHVWTADTATRRKYGRLRFTGKHELAHRVAWFIAHGEIPDGMCVLHRCDNPSCVRADGHLFLGTSVDNTRDRVAKQRSHHPSGELHPMAKLTADDVRVIRTRRASGHMLASIAVDYGISAAHVCDIARGNNWKHI
jgi:hypothetical protein